MIATPVHVSVVPANPALTALRYLEYSPEPETSVSFRVIFTSKVRVGSSRCRLMLYPVGSPLPASGGYVEFAPYGRAVRPLQLAAMILLFCAK